MPSPWRVVLEKLPLVALALAAAAMTLRTHTALSADPLTLAERLANAPISCVAYLGQLFVPVGLSPFYSHPESGWPASQVAAALALIVTITAAAVIARRSYPYFFVGWFWYIAVLLPVLGLVHVALHARARSLHLSFADRALHRPGLGGYATCRVVSGSAWHLASARRCCW